MSMICSIGFSQKRKITANLKQSTIGYSMSHPMHDWTAKATPSQAVMAYNDTDKKIEAIAIIVPVSNFDSGNSNRDSHALEVLDALKTHNVTFSSSSIKENGNELLVSGKLTFHGVSKNIELKVSKSNSGNSTIYKGAFDVNMKDYGVVPPGLMGIKTNEMIKMNFSISFDI